MTQRAAGRATHTIRVPTLAEPIACGGCKQGGPVVPWRQSRSGRFRGFLVAPDNLKPFGILVNSLKESNIGNLSVVVHENVDAIGSVLLRNNRRGRQQPTLTSNQFSNEDGNVFHRGRKRLLGYRPRNYRVSLRGRLRRRDRYVPRPGKTPASSRFLVERLSLFVHSYLPSSVMIPCWKRLSIIVEYVIGIRRPSHKQSMCRTGVRFTSIRKPS